MGQHKDKVPKIEKIPEDEGYHTVFGGCWNDVSDGRKIALLVTKINDVIDWVNNHGTTST